MNKIFLIGNLTKDPELLQAGSSGASVCKFGIAVNRRVSGNQETDFYNIAVWRALGENCSKYLKKGNKVAINGDIILRNYEDKNGIKKISVDVTAEAVEFLTPVNSSEKVEEQQEMKPVDDSQLPF